MTLAYRYLASLCATLLVVSMLVFAVNEFSPGSAARKTLGVFATQEQVDLLTQELGLDRPLLIRYAEYMTNVATGDLGYSLRYKQPVNEIIWERLWNTGILAAISFFLVILLSVTLGLLAGMRETSWLDRAIVLFSVSAASVPEFALGVALGSIFVVWLGWLPWAATLSSSSGWSVASQLVLPVMVIVLYVSGYVINIVRASMIEVMQEPYMRTAVLKGMGRWRVVTHHALRNALITPVAVIFLQLNYLISGLVVVEMVFAYPGFGRMMLEAALFKDIAVLEAGALIAVFVAVLSQLLSDAAAYLLDPRLRL